MAVTTQMRTQVTQLYVSLFGRAPEASGLGYWVKKLGEGTSLQTVAQDMFNVAPSRVYYPSSLTNEEIVAKFYVNVLGRTADADGLAYWTGRLNTESTTGTAASRANAVGTVVTELLQAVVNTPADSTNAAALASKSLLNNKVAVGLKYAFEMSGDNVAEASSLIPLVTGGANGQDAANAKIAEIFNHAPSFSAAAVAVSAMEDAALTGKVTATDSDANDVLTYALGTNAAHGTVTVAADGSYSYQGGQDFNGADSFTVVVTDKVGAKSTQTVNVTVANVNDAPVATSGATATIAENAAAATVLYTAAASDIDAGDKIAYSLKAGDDAAMLNIDPVTGAVTLKASANFEAKASYSFTVVATDKAGATAEKAVVASVTDVNEAPAVTSSATATIAENAATSTVLYTAAASDVDANDAVTYSLKATGDASMLSIDSATGAVTLNASANFEAKAAYNFTVVATDKAGATAEKAVAATVTNVNEAPVATSGATATIAENAAASTVVYTAAASDVDAGDALVFSLKAGDDAAMLNIDPATGVVTLKASANFEAKAAYNFTVVATDKAGAMAEKAVVATVTNVNEAPVITSSATVTLAESAATATVLYTATASDVDAGDTATFSLKAIGDASKLVIDAATGVVSIKASSGHEPQSSYGFTVVVTDKAGLSVEQAVVVKTSDFLLTNRTDIASANVFTANPVYTPGGNDLINSLQDEDQLTGVGINPTLNATLGQSNDAAEGMITPILNNIQTMNVDVTGTTGIGFQNATGLKTLNINRITANNAATTMTDLDKSTTTLSVSNATRDGSVSFLYKEDNLLATDNALDFSLANTRLSSLTIGETGDAPDLGGSGEDLGYGFETVNVTVKESSNIDNFTIGANQREDIAGTVAAPAHQTLNITANAATEFNNLTAVGAEFINLVANAEVVIAKDERNTLQATNDGISTTDLRKLVITGAANVTIDGLNGHITGTVNGDASTTLVVDASAMLGNLKLGVQAASDAVFTDKDVSITSGSGNDIIETYTSLAGDITTNAGDDQVLVNNGGLTPTWTDVEGVSTINTGTGKDIVRAKDLLATPDDVTAGNTTFGDVTAAAVITGEGDDIVSVSNLLSNKDWNNGVLNDANLDDTYFVKGASISTGAGADVVTLATLAEGAMLDTGADNDTLNIDINGGTILAGDDDVKSGTMFREVNLDGTVNVFGAIVELGDGDDTANVIDAISLTTAATTIVGTDAELRAGNGNDTLNVTALDAVNVVSATSYTSASKNDINVNVFGVETANFTVANQVDADSKAATGTAANDNVETDGSITADIMRFDTDLTAINLVSQEAALLQNPEFEIWEAGEATTFTLNNFRDGIALTLKANEATGVTAGKLKDDEAVDVNLTVTHAAARGHAESFTLNIAEGSGAFDLNLNLNATATDTVGNAASKTDDDDMRVENVTVKLAADDKGHFINFNNFGDAVHSDAMSEGSKVVNTSLTVTGGTAGTTLVLHDVSTDSVNAVGAANVKLKMVGSNNYVINTGSGNDVINMFADDVRANDLTDDGDVDLVDATDEADAINAGAGNDRMIINGGDNLGNFVGNGLTTDDDVFMKIKSVESIEVQGGGANAIIIDEAAATSGTNLQNIYFTGAGLQTTNVQIGNNFSNNGTVANTLNLDSTKSFTADKGAAAKSAALTLIIDSQDQDQDTDLVNLNVMVGMEKGTDVNFFNAGDNNANVNITATVAANSANTVGKSIGAVNGNLSLEVTTGSIDKVTLLDSADALDTNDNGQITITVDNSWSKTTLEFDASAVMNDDEAGMDLLIEETEGSGDPAVTQVAGIDLGDTGGLVFIGTGELDAKLIVRGTQNDDNITGSSQDDTLDGNAGDDIIVGGLGADSISGGAGNDDLNGGIGKDTINGGDGDDMIFGGLGADALDGGDGNDTFTYTAVTESNGGDADVITGFVSGEDKIVINGVVAGGADQDFINLSSFKEVTSVGEGDNSLAGNTGAGNAVMGDAYYGSGQLVIDVDGNGDITTGADIVIKSAGQIKASDINYTITAGAGNDFIRGGQGSDDLNGGLGNDTFVLLGSLTDAEASAYASTFQASGQVSSSVLGVTLATVETKMIAHTELMSSRTETEVNTGDKINSAGADATDTIHVFGTADLSKINAGAALNVGTLVVHSSVTMTYTQVAALGAILFDGNMPHAVTMKQDTGTALDTVAAIMAKFMFLGAGAATTFTITAPDGVLTAAWDPVDMRMEVVTNTSGLVGVAGTPIAGLGGAKDLADKTYASAAIQYSFGLINYEIVDTATAIAAGTTPVLDASTSVTVNSTTADAALLNVIDGKTTKLVNATAVTLLTGNAFELNNALDDQATIDTAANVAVTLSGAMGSQQVDASLLNAINSNTTGLVNATAVGFLYGTAADVLNSMDSPAEMTVTSNVYAFIYDSQAKASDLNAIDLLTTTVVSAGGTYNSYVNTITGTSAEVWNAVDDQTTIITSNNVNIKLSGLVAAGDVLNISGTTSGTITATTLTGTTGFNGNAADLSDMFDLGIVTSPAAAVTVTGTAAEAADLANIEGYTTAVVNALSVTMITGTQTDAVAALDNQGDTDTKADVAVTLVNDGDGIAATLNLIDTYTTGLVNATAFTTITGSAADVLEAVNDQAQMSTSGTVAITLDVGGTVAATVLNAIDAATSGLVDVTAVTEITGTAADVWNAVDNQLAMETLFNVNLTLSAGTTTAATLNNLNGATTGLVNATAITAIDGTDVAVLDAIDTQGEMSTSGSILTTITSITSAAANLNAINAITTGVVNVAAVTTITGSAAHTSLAYVNGVLGEFSGLGNEAVTLDDTTLAAALLNTLNGQTTGVVNAATVTTLTGTTADVSIAYVAGVAAEISGLGNEAVTISDTTLAVAALNTLDGQTSGVVDAATVTTLTGAAAAANSAYVSVGITGLGNEAVTLDDTTLAVAVLNTLDTNTSGVVNAATVTTLTGAAAAFTAYLSAGITGLGDEAVTLDDVTLDAVLLQDLNLLTTGVVNAGTVTTLTGSASEASIVYAAGVLGQISGLGNEAVTIDDVTLAAAALNTLNGQTTGAVNAATVTTLTGSAAAASAAYVAGVATEITGLGNEAVTLDDVTLAAANLNTLNGQTSGVVAAATVTTLTGTAAAVSAAYVAGVALEISGLGDEAVTLSGTNTVTELNTLNGQTSGVITFGTVMATTSSDTIDFGDAGFDAAAHTIKYTAGNQTVSFDNLDVDVDNTLSDGDTFTPAGTADVIAFDGTDILDLTAFGLGSLANANVLYVADNQKVGDNEWTMVRGTWAMNVFTADVAGLDTLVLWDSNPGGSVTQSAVVITGVPTLTFGSTILV